MALKLKFNPLISEDVIPIVRYWTTMPESYWESISIDPRKIADEDILIKRFHSIAKLPSRNRRIVVIRMNDALVGFCSLKRIDNLIGVFHIHLISYEYLGQGIGTLAYNRVLKYFFHVFKLDKIIFYTPTKNLRANAVKDKIGARFVSYKKVSDMIYYNETPVKVYEIEKPSSSYRSVVSI